MTTRAVSVVTVVFEVEIPLLLLQARSLRAHVPAERIARYIVIDNTARGLSPADRRRIAGELGDHAPRLRVVRPADLVDVPAAKGWVVQQVLKLAVSALVDTDHYVALDAKNHFVRTPAPDFFVSADGRARVNTYSYEEHPLRPQLETVLAYTGLEPGALVRDFTATVTPFVFDTARVRRTIAEVEERSGSPFADEFVRAGLTEFFLYTAWALRDGATIDAVFDVQQVFCPVLWPRRNSLAHVDDVRERLDDERVPLLSAHRNALADLPRPAADALAALWVSHGLFASPREARGFLRRFRINRLVQTALLRARAKLPARGGRAPRAALAQAAAREG
ncbi:DUF6492 family protein [Microbacterium sp. No. 7]|uniref:DUF6492 family protein n=1 Tax=Microbacterium sp. No. 7 TaxID=1714373 RepID=UPI0006D114A6|nr:DUF6492 family protein [Microbacterium sp. No. 7]ALJ19075.1 hypothetical protein AOA12_03810 [Microbacterium sp. No. 7]